jgi:outer membrane protein
MKKVLLIITGVIMLGAGAANAQKLGHVNSQEILFALPDYKKADASMQEFTKERMGEYEKMKTKLETMMNDYETKKPTMSEPERKLKEQDIMSYQNNIGTFEQEYQTNLEKRQQILMEPLVKQVKDAIAKVAKAQGLNYVVDTNTLLYSEGGNDITPLVKKDLGIVDAPTGPTTPTNTPGKTPVK